VGNYCYVAFARRRERAWVPTGGGEGREHIVAAARLQLVFTSRVLLITRFVSKC